MSCVTHAVFVTQIYPDPLPPFASGHFKAVSIVVLTPLHVMDSSGRFCVSDCRFVEDIFKRIQSDKSGNMELSCNTAEEFSSSLQIIDIRIHFWGFLFGIYGKESGTDTERPPNV
jgi:hypothetical protein